MPATKPASLVDTTHHQSGQSRADRAAAERALIPATTLTAATPPILSGHAKAARLWKHLIALHAETKAAKEGNPILTAWDGELLIKYCLVVEECDWLARIRAQVERQYAAVNKAVAKTKPSAETMKDYLNLLAQLNALLARLQGFDARLDGKRKLAHTLEQSLYLTPRSRAGVAPPEKDPEPEPTGMEAMLGD